LQTFQEIRQQIISNGLESDFYYKGSDAVYGGYNLEQNPDELAAYIMAVKQIFPNGIPEYLEIGVAACGLVRTMCEFVGIEHVVILDDGSWQYAKRRENLDEIERMTERLTILALNSQSQDAKDRLRETYQNSYPNLVMIDGDHTYNGVWGDINTVLSVATNDTIIAMHDVVSAKDPGVDAAMAQAIVNKLLVLENIFVGDDNKLGIAMLGRA
jgi:hypothetical protein